MSFAGEIQKLLGQVVPWFIRNKNLGTLLEAYGLVNDTQVETLQQGLRLSEPLRCDASALPFLSRDRTIRLYDTEPEASKRYRLSQWRQLRRQFGTQQGGLRNVAPYFLPDTVLMRVVHQSGDGARATWHTLTTTGEYEIHKAIPSNWSWDGLILPWSRWWVIIYGASASALAALAAWDDGSEWDDGTLWDGGPSTAQIADLVSAWNESKATHSRLAGIIMTSDPDSFDPESTAVVDPAGWTSLPIGNWGQTIDPESGLATRPPYASFAYEVSYPSAWTDADEPLFWRNWVAIIQPESLHIAGQWCFVDAAMVTEATDTDTVLVARDLTGNDHEWVSPAGGAELDDDAFGAGLPGLVLGGEDYYELDEKMPAGNNWTVFAVVDPTSTGGTQILLGATDTERISVVEGGDVAVHDGTALRSGPAATLPIQLLTVVLDATAGEARFYRDGSLLTTETYDGDWSWDQTRIASLGGATAGSFFVGTIGMMMIVSEAMTATLAAANALIQTHYGI